MAKSRFRLRISRVIPSFNCRSKDSTTTAPCNPYPISRPATSYNLSPFHHRRRRHPPIVSNSSKCCSTRLHHHCAPRSVSSSGGEADAETDDLLLARGIRSSTYLWTKSEKWHIVCCASSENSPFSSPPRSKIDYNLFAGRKSRCSRVSESSGDDSGWFSTDEEYSYENNYDNYEGFSGTRGERESNCFAVSKVSADPKGDFRRSMVEMVAEKGIYDVEELRRLLHCFLALNDRCHREAILAAFADVWYAIFPSVALAATFPKMFCR